MPGGVREPGREGDGRVLPLRGAGAGGVCSKGSTEGTRGQP